MIKNIKKRKYSAFTLVEMSVVLFIISLLILLMLPNIAAQRKNAMKINKQALQTELNTQAQLYLSDKNVQSVSLDDLTKAHYLTKEQYEMIKREGLTIQVDE